MTSDGVFLDAAAAVGRRLVGDAVWHERRCSWVGPFPDGEHPWRVEYRGLDATVYDGTAGVGLFLAQLAAVTGDEDARRTALGALRHAAGAARTVPPARRDGLQGGVLGVAWAAVRGATLLGEEELLAEARELARIDPTPPGHRCPDVILGAAGAVVAQLELATSLQESRLTEAAMATGAALMGAASVRPHGWSWASPGARGPRHLCGISHGAGGIGWAFAELSAATDDARFSEAAEGAFAYERSWLDVRTGTWPDLRLRGQRRGAPGMIASPALGTWCHGEAGIALTRLRAAELLRSELFAGDAAHALEASRRHLANVLSGEIDDAGLCHGAAGIADVLVSAGDREAALALGRAMLDRRAADASWPCGMGEHQPPGLYRGASGVAWWLLRLHDPAVPSPLDPRIAGTLPVRPLTRDAGSA